ncbi:General transcription factor 3C polypeptide 3 [Acipenser ruthenus]|uniref:General transcription factor 3C polypeptide 3 n=1 Tax=Acipenser ruthenus TaxID=7906 RepID=A0A444UN60_ACIRT|nr:General transcription factor 3C polypeptide 3 [Acipenser ruthenus]
MRRCEEEGVSRSVQRAFTSMLGEGEEEEDEEDEGEEDEEGGDEEQTETFSAEIELNRENKKMLKGFSFLNHYLKLWGSCQESFYNMGRALHQLGLVHLAIHYYQPTLTCPVPHLSLTSSQLHEQRYPQSSTGRSRAWPQVNENLA